LLVARLGRSSPVSITPNARCALKLKGPPLMNEKELAKALQDMAAALLKRDSGGSADAGFTASKIIRRDKWRIRLVACAAILLWLLAVLMIGLLVYHWDHFQHLYAQMQMRTRNQESSVSAHDLQIQFAAVSKGL